MANEQDELNRVNWTEVFTFPQIFKSFRMAIHPSKLILAFVAIVILFAGGVILDSFWTLGNQYVVDNEISTKALRPDTFVVFMEQIDEDRPGKARDLLIATERERYYLGAYESYIRNSRHLFGEFSDLREKANAEKAFAASDGSDVLKDAQDDWDDVLEDAEDVHDDEIDRIDALLDEAYDEAEDAVEKIGDKKQRAEAAEALEKDYRAARVALTRRKAEFSRKVSVIRGQRLFAGLMEYEGKCVNNAIMAVCYGNIFGGLNDYKQALRLRSAPASEIAGARQAGWAGPNPPDETPGFIFNVLMALHGLAWLVTEHWVFALLLGVLGLSTTALLGGAVNRIAALHYAREEKISIAQALRFALGKFLSFFTAPLIPIAIIVCVGLLLMVGGLLINIPYIGEIIVALLFFLAIAAGLLVAFLLVGFFGGVGLMYPTIAVEGSDSFDAISRSFSYVFARPFRAAFYGLVAVVYGVITYLFVRLFAFLALSAAHCFVKWGVFVGGDRLAGEADKLDEIWAAPTFDKLWGTFNWSAMSGSESLAAFIIGIWVFLVAGLVAAYLLTYAASATTVIYYLLRRKVDATDLDDVYIEEAEEQPAEVEAAPQASPAAEATAEEGETPETPEPPQEEASQ